MIGVRARGRRCVGPLSAVALLLTGAVVAGVLGHDASVSAQQGEPLAVSLSDFMIEPARTTEVAGAVTFAVHNDGGVEHEFLVVRTNLALDALPLAAGEVDESQVEVVARIEPFGSGETRSLTVDLTPSTYLLLCNVPLHYEAGMRIAFTVLPAETPQPAPAADRAETPPTAPQPVAAATAGAGAGDDGLPAGAWAGIVISFLIGAFVIVVALPYMVPRRR